MTWLILIMITWLCAGPVLAALGHPILGLLALLSLVAVVQLGGWLVRERRVLATPKMRQRHRAF